MKRGPKGIRAVISSMAIKPFSDFPDEEGTEG